ncbi:unnamed protein product, partial [Timema podura]|nr:unnamed protein product [Timema podura]
MALVLEVWIVLVFQVELLRSLGPAGINEPVLHVYLFYCNHLTEELREKLHKLQPGRSSEDHDTDSGLESNENSSVSLKYETEPSHHAGRKKKKKKKKKDTVLDQFVLVTDLEGEIKTTQKLKEDQTTKTDNQPLPSPQYTEEFVTPPVLMPFQEKLLEDNFMYVLEKKSTKNLKAIYHCSICNYHCNNFAVVQTHIADDRHKNSLERNCCIRICMEVEWKTIFGKTTLGTSNRDSNLVLPVISSLVYCESSALDLEHFDGLVSVFLKKISDITLQNLPSPTSPQIDAITKLIEDIVAKRGENNSGLAGRRAICDRLNFWVCEHLPGCQIRMLGSSASALALKTSDLNLELVIPSECKAPLMLRTLAEYLEENDRDYRL